MRLYLRFLLVVAAALFCNMPLSAACDDRCDPGDFTRFDEELNERDFDVLRQYINSKRCLDLQDKACNLTISGDVRTEWRNIHEKRCGRSMRGGGAVDHHCVPLSNNDFDMELNLRFDYISECAWAVAHVLFDNSAGVDPGLPCKCDKKDCGCRDREKHCRHGIFADNGDKHHDKGCCEPKKCDPHGWQGSGSKCDINLRKAYMGVNLLDDYGMRLDVELGRRNLYNVFDSKVQFLSRFDGLLMKYNYYCGDTTYYAYLAGFVVDERVNQFAWVTELGWLNICNCCFDVKYSYIDWHKRGKNRCFVRNPDGFKFNNSQISLAYHLEDDCFWVPGKIYGAYLINHSAHSKKFYDCDPQRNAWYVGFTLGQVCIAGDWALDVQYQYVEAFSIPDRDVSGIGRGNVLGESITAGGRGNTNFKGYRVELLYAITDNLSLDTIWEHSNEIKKRFGGAQSYSKFEMEAIYAF